MVFNACEWDLLREFNGCFQEKLDFNGTFMIFINALCYRYGIHWILYGLICYPKKFITQKYHLQTKIYNGETRASQQCKTQCERLNNVFVHFTSLIILSLILWTILSSHFLSLILWTIPHEPPKKIQKGSPDWWELKQIESLQLKLLPPTFPSPHHFPSCRLAKCCPSSCCILSSSARCSSCCFLWASMAFSSWSRSRSRLGGAMNCSGCLGARGNSFSSSMENIPSGNQR